MIEFCIRNPVKVAVGVLVVVLFGGIALWRIPIQMTPEVNTPTVTVSVLWPGAGPYEIEHEIVHELEKVLKDVKGVTRMTSWSNYSQGSVTLEFPVGTDLTRAMLELNSRLSQMRAFPEDARPPVVSSANLSDRPVAWYVISPRVPDEAEIGAFARRHPDLAGECRTLTEAHKWDLRLLRLNELAKDHPEFSELLPVRDIRKSLTFVEEHVKSRFDRIKGVASMFVLGGQAEQMEVVVDPGELAARHLTVEDVRRALVDRNSDMSGGEIWDGKRRYVVRTLGRFADRRQIERTIVAKRDDVTTYVEDVAVVRLGHARPQSSYRRGGSELIGLGVLPETGANVLEVVGSSRELVDELNDGILAQRGLRISEVWSDADYIDSAVGLVQRNILVGGALTVLVLLVFLRSVRSTIVIAVAVPTSIIGTFLVLSLLGRSLNVVSLAGLAFAVGMIVDNSVVVLENVYRHHRLGSKPFESALRGTREVWGAVLASTLTTLAVFLPVLFTEEEAGQLFRDIALAISAAVGLSLLVSVTLIPTASARLLRPRMASGEAEPSWIDRVAGAFVSTIVRLNGWLLRGHLRRLAVILVFVGGSLVISWLLFPELEYLPRGNKARLQCRLYTPPGYNVRESEAISHRVFEDFRPYWEVDPSSPEAAALDAPPLEDLLVRAESWSVMVQVQTVEEGRIREWLPKLRGLQAAEAGVSVTAHQLSLFPNSSRKVDIEVTGPDVTSVVELAGQVQERIDATIPGVQTSTSPGLFNANPELHVEPNWDRLAEFGLDATRLGYVVDTLADGAYAAEYTKGGEKIDLRILGSEEYVDRTQEIGRRTLATADGGLVPLNELAQFQIGSGPPRIHHVERRRAIVVEARPPDGMPIGRLLQVLDRDVIRPLRTEGAVPVGAHVGLGGSADRLLEAWDAMQFNLLLALVVTYLLMAGLFESWLYPLVVILTVPLAAVGGLACLSLVNRFVEQPLDVITMLGFVILIGTAVNNAILIVHQALNLMRSGVAPREAVVESVGSRIRPIFMTTATTVLGLFPLVVMPGDGSELYRGLGSVVLGGLVVSTVLTLFLVPSFFSLVMDAVTRHDSEHAATNVNEDMGGRGHFESTVETPKLHSTEPVAHPGGLS